MARQSTASAPPHLLARITASLDDAELSALTDMIKRAKLTNDRKGDRFIYTAHTNEMP